MINKVIPREPGTIISYQILSLLEPNVHLKFPIFSWVYTRFKGYDIIWPSTPLLVIISKTLLMIQSRNINIRPEGVQVTNFPGFYTEYWIQSLWLAVKIPTIGCETSSWRLILRYQPIQYFILHSVTAITQEGSSHINSRIINYSIPVPPIPNNSWILRNSLHRPVHVLQQALVPFGSCPSPTL